MQLWTSGRASVAAITALLSSSALAQKIPRGIYSMPDSGYSISTQPSGDDLLVSEAGEGRCYLAAGPGSNQHRSDIRNPTYDLRYLDRGSVSALKLGSGGAPALRSAAR